MLVDNMASTNGIGMSPPLSSLKMSKPIGKMSDDELRQLVANKSMMESVRDLAKKELKTRKTLEVSA